MSGGKLYPLFAEVRRHAEEGRANVLVSLELLRREVEEIRNEQRNVYNAGQLTVDETNMVKEWIANYRDQMKRVLVDPPPNTAKRKTKVKEKSKARPTNGRRKHARRKK